MQNILTKLNEFKATLALAAFFVVAGWYGATTLQKASWILEKLVEKTGKLEEKSEKLEELIDSLDNRSSTNAIQVAQNTRVILTLRYVELDAKRRHVGLSPSEYAEFCRIGRQLQYFSQCPSPDPNNAGQR